MAVVEKTSFRQSGGKAKLKSRRVEFLCGSIKLEGELCLPEGKTQFSLVIVCHPHPLYGGDMDNNVVVTICDALERESISSLRFNFRGVGCSEGSFGGGVGERDDVKAALDFVIFTTGVAFGRIGLSGYSFGGEVALAVALKENRFRQLALISPALKDSDWAHLGKYSRPKLVMVGDADTVVSQRTITQYFNNTKQYQIIAGADHSWSGYESEVGLRVAEFFTGLNK
jgi:alpha/beta superfamily hydrolase